MAILDSPILPALTTLTGAEQLVTVGPSRTQAQLKVNGINGLLSGDVAVLPATGAGSGITGQAVTLSKRLTVVTSSAADAAAISLPLASGDLRELIVMRTGATYTATLTRSGSDVIVGATTTDTTVSIAVGKAARLLSDGTKWYHVSNDA